MFYPDWAPPDQWRQVLRLGRGRLTHVMSDQDMPHEMVCGLQAANVQVFSLVNMIPLNLLVDGDAVSLWVANVAAEIRAKHLDGVNIDIENLEQDAPEYAEALVRLTRDLRVASGGATISWAIAAGTTYWQKFYPYPQLFRAMGPGGFFIMMLYDTNWNSARAKGNLDAAAIRDYVENFSLLQNVPPSAIVAGLPWYGWEYDCATASSRHQPCELAGAFMQSARQVSYAHIKRHLAEHRHQMWTDEASQNVFASRGQRQFVFDRPETLEVKRNLACELASGTAIWASTHLDYEDEAEAQAFYDASICQ
jgi:hypothetical protein